MNHKAMFVHKALAGFFCILISAFILTVPASAAVSEPTVIYVAGNPDLYPIEYYDSSSEEYLGLMPDIYHLIEEETQYSFVYVQPGVKNAQEQIAKNTQAEIISAHIDGNIQEQYIHNSIPITVIENQGEKKTVYIAFSEIASEKLISDVTQAINEINDSQKLAMIVSHTTINNHNGKHLIWIYVLSGALLLILLALTVIFIVLQKKRRKNKKDTMIDPEYGIGNDLYYVYSFQNLISEKSKALYYVAYIAFDEKSFNQKFGDEECRELQRYTAEFLNRQTTAVEYLAIVRKGVYSFVYQAANKDTAEERITNILSELNLYLTNIKNEYSKLFHAGICSLEENMDCTAETAFYNAKQGYLQAINCNRTFAFSTKAMITEAHRKEGMNRRIMQAISDGEFVIHLQYIVERNGNLFGAEAVARWQHPHEGLISSAKYITMINQSDIITQHDLYIFSLVCKQLESWKKSSRKNLCISCNFTRYSLTFPELFERVREISEQYDFDHNKLIIEITEDSLSCNSKSLKENLQKYKNLGFLIALDDIGSGYSALTDLYNYPIDYIKIEREIILQAMEPRGKMLLDGLIRLAHSMNMKVLCEGVETKEQNDMVLTTECEYIQGFFYSHALPLKEAERYLQQHGFYQ